MLKHVDTYERAHGHTHTTPPNKLNICVNHEHLEVDLNMLGSDDFNLLHVACSSASIETIEYLLNQRKLNPNTEGKDQWRPLEILVKIGFTEGVQLLVHHKKINLSYQSDRGSLLHTAVRQKDFKIC